MGRDYFFSQLSCVTVLLTIFLLICEFTLITMMYTLIIVQILSSHTQARAHVYLHTYMTNRCKYGAPVMPQSVYVRDHNRLCWNICKVLLWICDTYSKILL